MNKRKVIVFQGDSKGIDLSYEDMIAKWKESLDKISEIGEYRIVKSNKLSIEDYHESLQGVDAALGMWITKEFIQEDIFTRHPNLKYISTLSHGYGEFDRSITKKYGVTLSNTIYGDKTIAQFSMSLLLAICNGVSEQSLYTKELYWKEKEKNKKANYFKELIPQIELYEKTIGIIGLGAIGLSMANMAKSFGMKVIAYSRSKKEGPEYEGIEQVAFEELLLRSDVISIHCPHTKETEKLLNKQAFHSMKNGVILINTARGAIIDEDALLDALNSRKVYMAGLDVITMEPPSYRIPLMESPYTYITSHIAWLPKTSRLRSIDICIDNYVSYLHGIPKSIIK